LGRRLDRMLMVLSIEVSRKYSKSKFSSLRVAALIVFMMRSRVSLKNKIGVVE
jgi:hypothetical protein